MTDKRITENPDLNSQVSFTYTPDDMERDRRFYMAEQMTRKLLEGGSITEEEFEKIMDEHIVNFNPTLAPVMR